MKKTFLFIIFLALFIFLAQNSIAAPQPSDPLETELPCSGNPCYDPIPKSVTSDSFNIYMVPMAGIPPRYSWSPVVDGYSMFYPGTIVFTNRTTPIHACITGRSGVFVVRDPLSNPPSIWGLEIKYLGGDDQGHLYWAADFTPWSCVNNPYGYPLTRPWCNKNFTSPPGESYIGDPTQCYATIFFDGQNGGMWIPPHKTWLTTISNSRIVGESLPTPYP